MKTYCRKINGLKRKDRISGVKNDPQIVRKAVKKLEERF